MAGARERGERLNEEGLALARTLADERAIASLTHRLAMSALVRGDRERARVLADESHALAAGRFPFVDIPNYSVLGQVLVADGEVERGTELVRRGAELARELGWDWWLAGQLGNLMFLALDRGDLAEADRDGREALRLEWQQENRHWALYALTGLARVALARGAPERAGLLWGAVEAEGARARYGSWEAARAGVAGELTRERSAAFAAGVEQGRALDVWDAAAIALE
jgi:ATP/maltotriose-dependent transcriptional regulator MalT